MRNLLVEKKDLIELNKLISTEFKKIDKNNLDIHSLSNMFNEVLFMLELENEITISVDKITSESELESQSETKKRPKTYLKIIPKVQSSNLEWDEFLFQFTESNSPKILSEVFHTFCHILKLKENKELLHSYLNKEYLNSFYEFIFPIWLEEFFNEEIKNYKFEIIEKTEISFTVTVSFDTSEEQFQIELDGNYLIDNYSYFTFKLARAKTAQFTYNKKKSQNNSEKDIIQTKKITKKINDEIDDEIDDEDYKNDYDFEDDSEINSYELTNVEKDYDDYNDYDDYDE